jgi:hypothetical protein
MSLVYGDTTDSLENRRNFLKKLGIDYQDLVCAKQVHGGRTAYVRETERGKGALSFENALEDVDALITDKRNLPLAVFTADCLTIFLYDPVGVSIGIIHAGWRSTRENIAAKTIQLMQKKFNTETRTLYVGFGPAIRCCCYEVQEELIRYFPDNFLKRDGHYYLDLVGINKRQLLDLGIKDINISDSKICTSCQNKEFFSYRREGKNCGRMMSVIMLK